MALGSILYLLRLNIAPGLGASLQMLFERGCRLLALLNRFKTLVPSLRAVSFVLSVALIELLNLIEFVKGLLLMIVCVQILGYLLDDSVVAVVAHLAAMLQRGHQVQQVRIHLPLVGRTIFVKAQCVGSLKVLDCRLEQVEVLFVELDHVLVGLSSGFLSLRLALVDKLQVHN